MALWEGMTPADFIDDLGHAIAERYRRIEEALEATLRRHLEQAIASPPDLAARLAAVRDLRDQAALLVQTVPPDQIAELVARITGGEAATEVARQLLSVPALSPSTLTAGGLWAVAAAETELRDSLRALNARILRAPADAYQAMTAMTIGDILAGASTWQQLQRRQVDRYVADGITGFIDRGGRRWRIGSYAEMATRTAAARAWRDQSVASMTEHGIETFTIVIGSDACAECGAWAGKVLTDGGPTGDIVVPHAITAEPTVIHVDGTLAQARAAGWGHPNCRCVLVAALPGLDRSGLTTHDPEQEKARDKLRELEREVRDAKRGGDPDEIGEAQAKLRQHVKETGATRRPFREQLPFADGGDKNPRGRFKPTGGPKVPDVPGPRIAATGELATELRAARRSIGRVHSFPDAAGPVVRVASLRPGLQGRHIMPTDRIDIGAEAMNARLTLAHEYGHHLDYALGDGRKATSGALTGPWRDLFTALNSSQEVERLRILRGSQSVPPELRRHITYLLQRDELWARAYAQYIAQTSRDRTMIAGVQRMLAETSPLMSHRQWSVESFAPISAAIEAILREVGWLA